jgi:hypothetical protein
MLLLAAMILKENDQIYSFQLAALEVLLGVALLAVALLAVAVAVK